MESWGIICASGFFNNATLHWLQSVHFGIVLRSKFIFENSRLWRCNAARGLRAHKKDRVITHQSIKLISNLQWSIHLTLNIIKYPIKVIPIHSKVVSVKWSWMFVPFTPNVWLAICGLMGLKAFTTKFSMVSMYTMWVRCDMLLKCTMY